MSILRLIAIAALAGGLFVPQQAAAFGCFTEPNCSTSWAARFHAAPAPTVYNPIAPEPAYFHPVRQTPTLYFQPSYPTPPQTAYRVHGYYHGIVHHHRHHQAHPRVYTHDEVPIRPSRRAYHHPTPVHSYGALSAVPSAPVGACPVGVTQDYAPRRRGLIPPEWTGCR